MEYPHVVNVPSLGNWRAIHLFKLVIATAHVLDDAIGTFIVSTELFLLGLVDPAFDDKVSRLEGANSDASIVPLRDVLLVRSDLDSCILAPFLREVKIGSDGFVITLRVKLGSGMVGMPAWMGMTASMPKAKEKGVRPVERRGVVR